MTTLIFSIDKLKIKKDFYDLLFVVKVLQIPIKYPMHRV